MTPLITRHAQAENDGMAENMPGKVPNYLSDLAGRIEWVIVEPVIRPGQWVRFVKKLFTLTSSTIASASNARRASADPLVCLDLQRAVHN